MKKKFVGFSTLLIAATAIPFLIRQHYRKKEKDQTFYKNTVDTFEDMNPLETDYKDSEHLIFCEESHLGRRLIQLEQSINIRDLGGYTGLDHQKTKWKKIIRSEELNHLSDNDIKALENLGIKYVIDFRGESKATKLPDKLPKTAKYLHIPLLAELPYTPADIDYDDPTGIDTFMRKIYRYQVENRAVDFAKVLKLLTKAESYPLLYHCTNGKDRTGIMTAFILLICGVPEETIISDYTLTNLTFDEAFDVLGSLLTESYQNSNTLPTIDKNKLRDFFGVKPAWLKIVLEYIRTEYGTVEAYFKANTDLTDADFKAIRENMLAEKEVPTA